MPKRAQTVAVATPCWPAPVSAMIRVLPIRRASRIWPRALLSLWAPVCSRSSRLNQTPPPACSDIRSARYSGVGRPPKSRLSASSSSAKALSARAKASAASSSSRAGISVAETYCPPNFPNRPATAFASANGSHLHLRRPGGADVLADLAGILDSRAGLEAAGGVDAPGPEVSHRIGDVAGVQATANHQPVVEGPVLGPP